MDNVFSICWNFMLRNKTNFVKWVECHYITITMKVNSPDMLSLLSFSPAKIVCINLILLTLAKIMVEDELLQCVKYIGHIFTLDCGICDNICLKITVNLTLKISWILNKIFWKLTNSDDWSSVKSCQLFSFVALTSFPLFVGKLWEEFLSSIFR